MSESLGPARRRVLRAVLELTGDAPVTLTEIVKLLGGHPNTTRQQLDRLVAAGHLDVATLSHGKPGRPPKTYALTDRGRRSLGEGQLGGLVGAVTTHFADLPDPEGAALSVGRAWGATSVEDQVGEPVAVVVELLDILGFEPRSVGTHGEVVLTNCPLVGGTGSCHELTCQLHQGMLEGALAQLGANQGVRLTPFSHPDGCGVSFTDLHEAHEVDDQPEIPPALIA